MRHLNQIMLIGFVGKDAEIKTWNSGDKYMIFSVGTEERWKDKQTGEWKGVTEWHRIQVSNQSFIDRVGPDIVKFATVLVIGKKQSRTWEKRDNTKETIVEIHVKSPEHQVQVLAPPTQHKEKHRPSPAQADPAMLEDDEIPF